MVTFRKLGRLGRFGNQLFQYAETRLYAHLNDYSYSFPKWIGNNIFNDIKPYTQAEFLKSRFLPTCQLDDLKSYGKIERIKYIFGLIKELPQTISIKELYENPRDNINLYGYLQDEFSLQLLAEHKNLILKWFTFKKDMDDAYNYLTKDFGPWVALHIRRGDLIKRGAVVSLKSYLEILERVRNKRNVYIATDDKNLISELEHLNPMVLKNIPDYIFDFWMLKNAQTVIAGGSTFSWWASYLGNKNDYYSAPLTHTWKNFRKIEITKQNI